MGKKISSFLLACLLVVIIADRSPAQEQVPVVKGKPSTVLVPKVTGMMQKDAEMAITKAGLVVSKIIERETKFPAGRVVRQQPLPETRVESGSGVILVVSAGKAAPAETPAKAPTGGRRQELIPDVEGMTFSEAFQTIRKAGFVTIKPQPMRSSEPKETVLAVQVNGESNEAGQEYPLNASITLLISSGVKTGGFSLPTGSQVIDTPALVMTGMGAQPQTIATQPLKMTGMRVQPQIISTQPLQMTGLRMQSQTITTQPLRMTGLRAQSQTISTQPLQMTGMRATSQTITTQQLKMTGMR